MLSEAYQKSPGDGFRREAITMTEWREHLLVRPDLEMTWYEAGNGPTVVFLSGGPGDDHAYLRDVVEPLSDGFRWVLYDQRGTGRSRLARYDRETLHIERFLDDLESLQQELGGEPLRLAGHSWGANLALLFAASHPQAVDRLALVSLGTLNEAFGAVARANSEKPLTVAERERRTQLRAERDVALAAGDEGRLRAAFLEGAELGLRGSFFSPETAQRFFKVFSAGSAYEGRVAPNLLPTVQEIPLFELLPGFDAPTLVLYGYQDFEPITQAYVLRELLPQAELAFINECGHVPWWEQPDEFYRVLGEFLSR
jgi:proline iminopeptidase